LSSPNLIFYSKKSILDQITHTTHQLILFYGSQTGTAEDLANRLAKDTSNGLDLPTLVCDIEDYDMEELLKLPTRDPDRKLLIGFFMATYGVFMPIHF
jgi:NADPH-ferrihemoprotein reductase